MKKKYISNHPNETIWINKKGFYESDEFEVLSVKNGNWIILIGTVGDNNGKKYQSYKYSLNANIESVRRKSDNKIFFANGDWDNINKHYRTHFWFNNSLKTISVAGYYTKENKENNGYFSCNMMSLKNLK